MTDHPPIDASGAVLLDSFLGVTCTICAPCAMTKVEVEAAALQLIPPTHTAWKAYNKAGWLIQMGERTPSPCSVCQDRQHWFLASLPDRVLKKGTRNGGSTDAASIF